MKIKKIHLIGICGIAMGSFAGMLKEKGYTVTGSDQDIYPPMSDILAGSNITTYRGYRAQNVGDADLVIVGNAISRGNPEVEHVLNRGIPYMSMAQGLYNFFLKDKEVIAVAGTHGKSTTTALIAHILKSAGMSPSFFVGGVINNYNTNFGLGDGRFFVIEADEYDSAFFEKVPKFIFYRPRHLLLTSLEMDHADIYSNIDEIELWFRRLVNCVPSEGSIVYSDAYPILKGVIAKAFTPAHSFSVNGGGDFNCAYEGCDGAHVRIRLNSRIHGEAILETGLLGEYNYANVAAAAAVALTAGVSMEALSKGVNTFQGVKRRQELIYSRGPIKIYEDFAHHPTAIRYFLETMKRHFPNARLWAVYEPRSATSRRNTFQDELPGAFAPADRVFIKTPFRIDGIPEGERIDIVRVIDMINRDAVKGELCGTVDEIIGRLSGAIDPGEENIIALLSNGGFDGIYGKITGAMDGLLQTGV